MKRNKMDREAFKKVNFERFKRWDGEAVWFCCSCMY